MKIRIEIEEAIEEDELVLRCSELNDEIIALQKKIAEHGDLEITVNTKNGGFYRLFNKDCIHKIEWTNTKDGTKIATLEIG